MRDFAPSHISDKTTEFIKNIKMKECKDWVPYSIISTQLKIFENIQITSIEE